MASSAVRLVTPLKAAAVTYVLGTGRENHQELLATVSGDQTFSNLDLSHVYQQVPLTEDSQVHDCVHDQDHPQRPVQVHENTF